MKKRITKLVKIALLSLFVIPIVGCNNNNDSKNNDSTTTSNDGPFSGTLAKGEDLKGEKGIAIRYTRRDKNYKNRALWIWENNGGEGKEYTFSTSDDFGAVCFLPLSTWSSEVETNGLGVITKPVGSWDGQSADLFVDFTLYNVDQQGYYNIFLREGENNIFDNPDLKYVDKFKSAKFVTTDRIVIETTNDFNKVTLYEDGNIIKTVDQFKSNYLNIDFDSSFKVKIGSKYEAEVKFVESGDSMKTNVSKIGLFDKDEFNDEYYYDGELGAIYSQEKTTFKVWSPLSTKIELRIYNSGTPKKIDPLKGDDTFTTYTMTKGEKGVFSYDVESDLQGKYYTYVVTNDRYTNEEIVDPYAKSSGINGLRGMIVDFEKTNPLGWENVKMNSIERTKLVIYETHVADVTSSQTWGGSEKDSKKFKGMFEENTTYTKDGVSVKTGFDHIKELGVNAVELLPIFDQANDEVNPSFNWGYNPLNYNCLEGSYSSDPYDGYTKIKEFKQLVQKYTNAGINIIMDVVYNHLNSALKSNFDILMPEYYFRYKMDGGLSNGSGCGNETRSELKMMRKFIKDSTLFLAKEYKLGGFRFDLMGLHDVDTMNEVSKNLKDNIDVNFFIHGEPWTGGDSPLVGNKQAKQDNIDKFEGYGAFNDQTRDALIKGGLCDKKEKGWATDTAKSLSTDYKKLAKGVLGHTASKSSDPLKSTNYVSCHDNYTLYDRIKATGFTGTDLEIAQMATLANSVIFTSQGTAFMLAGEEMLRSKDGNSNSYNATYKVNQLDYSRLITFKDLYENYKNLIKLKTSFDGLQFTDNKTINEKVTVSEAKDTNDILDYTITGSEKTYRIIHGSAALKDTKIDISNYNIVLQTKNNTVSSSEYNLTKNTTLVLEKIINSL